MTDYIAELVAAVEGKEPGDAVPGPSQYAAQQVIKSAGLKGAFKLPLNAGRIRSLLKAVKDLDLAIEKVQSPEPEIPKPAPRADDGKRRRNEPRRKHEVDFVAQRRYSAVLRHRQRSIDNWWWKEGMWRSTLEQCRCGLEHLMIEVKSEGGRLDNMCPMLFWGRMVLAFPTIFPSTDEGMRRFFEPVTKWLYVRPRGGEDEDTAQPAARRTSEMDRQPGRKSQGATASP